MAQEKVYENKIKKYIEDNDGWQIKYFANRMTKSGIPDILACINGYFLAIEVKAEHGKPSKLQKYHRDRIIEAEGFAIILYPQDWGLFKQLIDALIDDCFYAARELCNQINERSL